MLYLFLRGAGHECVWRREEIAREKNSMQQPSTNRKRSVNHAVGTLAEIY